MGIPQGCESIGYALQGALNAAGVPFFYLMEELQALAPSSTIMGALYNGLSTPDAEGCVMGFPECESMGYALQFSLMDAGVSFSDLMNELQALAGAVYLGDCSISWFDSTGNLVGMGLSVSGLPAGTYTASLNHGIFGCADTQTIEVLFECGGCTDEWACNYNPAASQDDYSCDYSCCPGPGCCGEGTTWNWQTSECDVTNPADINLDGCVQLNDLLDLLSAYGDCGAEESAWQCGDPLEYQGYDYETVQIGEQCWFAENLRAENYRNGDVIPVVADDPTWNESTMGTKRPFENDLSNVSSMGYLYSWYAGNDDRELCPTGWHVPSRTELAQIEMALGMPESEALSEGWYGSDLNVSERMRSTSWGGSDELGFNVIRAPWHSGDINATQFLTSTLWDSNNGLNSTTQCWTLVVTSYQLSNYHADSALPGIYSVRCIKDAE